MSETPQVVGALISEEWMDRWASELPIEAREELEQVLRGQPRLTLPERFSLSFLANAERCMVLAEASRHAGGSELTAYGSAFHEVAAAVDTAHSFAGEAKLPDERMEAIAAKVLGQPERHEALSVAALRELREELVPKWWANYSFPADAGEVLIEWGSRVELDGRTFSARLDRVALYGDPPELAELTDYKAGPNLPSSEEVEKRLQLAAYAWHLFAGFPSLQEVRGQEEFVRYGVRLPREPMVFRPDDAAWMEEYLLTEAERVEGAYSAGELVATSGSWCSFCPVKQSCPLPEATRPAAIETAEEAEAQLSALLVEDERRKERRGALEAYFEASGLHEVEAGDKVALMAPKVSNRFDKKRAAEALDIDAKALTVDALKARGAEALGFDLEAYTEETTTGTELRIEKVKAGDGNE